MTQEEKARAYDEALKCAKMYYKENKDYNAGFLPIIFPELAKSEDEMIREAIIGIIKNSNIIDINVSEEKMIAYLEKQKEQKPEWSEEDEEMLKDIIAEIEATKQYFFTHDSEGRAQMQARIEWLKSLRPSWKPSEVQDYSNLSDLERAIHRGFLCAGVENVPVAIIKETAKEVQTLKADE